MAPPTTADIHAYLGDHTCSTHFLAQKCLIGGWASLMNLGRKGNAESLRQLGLRTFGAQACTTALSHALLDCQAPAGAIDGFARVGVKDLMELYSADDREMAKKSFVGAFICLISLRMAEPAQEVKAMGEKVFGEVAWDRRFWWLCLSIRARRARRTTR